MPYRRRGYSCSCSSRFVKCHIGHLIPHTSSSFNENELRDTVTARLLSKRTCIGCDATKKRLQQAHTTAPPTSKWLFSCIVVKSSRLVFWRRRLNEIHRIKQQRQPFIFWRKSLLFDAFLGNFHSFSAIFWFFGFVIFKCVSSLILQVHHRFSVFIIAAKTNAPEQVIFTPLASLLSNFYRLKQLFRQISPN